MARSPRLSRPSSSHSPTYAALLRAGPRLRPLLQAHARIVVSGAGASLPLLTTLLSLACAARAAPYARRLLASSCADLSASKSGRILHAHSILSAFDSDRFVQTALVVFYAKCGDLVVARKAFDRMPARNAVAWNAMISGYEQNGFGEKAIGVFREMRAAGEEPDSATFVGLLSAVSQVGTLGLGRWVDSYITERKMGVDVVLGTSLVNMYARCGLVRRAREVFDAVPQKNVITWTAMISGYGMHGYGRRAIELFHRMRNEGPQPNGVTFVAVLSACAHAGLVKEGREAFASMKMDYGLVPLVEHRVCMVDLYGRAGLLDDAMRFIRESIVGEPGPEVWTAMLGACKMHKDLTLGVEVAERLLAVEPDNPSHYVLLSNIFALAGRMDRVERVRDIMIRNGLKKQTGYSSTEINGTTHVFRMGDTFHPQTAEIYKYLEEMIHKIKETGYVAETDSVLHELEEEEREVALRFHSEKLAVAFGLMSTSDMTPIRVIKNLRMCDDCHLAIKFMSAVVGREIVVRDKHRFHHFKDGNCSCQDFW
ncbi:Pentatricopeptide repeat-containing protein [Ananas comosus]|uniref:Pentatricopeptide repeat-containing protein n=1 Tax=Ananas comosus TaxID=4615 RepID=A0A199VUG2_ANACO|nr:Pentatricopeptide repeat-containing protein [Ananas comosus]